MINQKEIFETIVDTKTPQGILKVEWEKEDNNSFKVNITVPEKSTVNIILKDKVNTTVSGGNYEFII